MVVWDRAKALEHAGYEVETCSGPSHADCPILRDQACPLLDHADVLVYDTALGTPQEMRLLVDHLRDTYADLPLVVIGTDGVPAPTAPEPNARVWRVPAVGTLAELTAVIEEAVTEQGMAV